MIVERRRSERQKRLERFERRDDGQWLLTDRAGPDTTVELPAIGCRLELAKVYDEVELAD